MGKLAENPRERVLKFAPTGLLFFLFASLLFFSSLKFVFGFFTGSWGHKELDTTEQLNWTELNELDLGVLSWRVETSTSPSSDLANQDRITETLCEHGLYHKWFFITHAILSYSKIHLIHMKKKKAPIHLFLQTVYFRTELTIFSLNHLKVRCKYHETSYLSFCFLRIKAILTWLQD